MVDRYESLVVRFVSCAVAPFLLLFALYVIAHGHYSPGGGFQGGAIMAGTAMLLRLTLGRKRTGTIFPPGLSPILGAIGLLIYFGTGLVPLMVGGNYLDYSFLPIPGLSDQELRYYGIMFVELGVALGVFGILLTIFDRIVEE